MIVNPITLSPAARIYEALELMRRYRISGVPITEEAKEGRLVILTNRDLRFETNVDRPIGSDDTGTAVHGAGGHDLGPGTGDPAPQGGEAPRRRCADYRLKGLITVKDIQKAINYPNACKDSLGRLRCGAAVGIARDLQRARRW